MIMAFFGWFDYDYTQKIIIIMIIDILVLSESVAFGGCSGMSSTKWRPAFFQGEELSDEP